MSKHTKAPWVVEESKWCGHDDCPYDHVKLTIVGGPAQLPIVSRDTYDHDLATARADAGLIAAAPDLLASLIEFRDSLISHAKFGLNDAEVAMLKRADAAIAKAEGKP